MQGQIAQLVEHRTENPGVVSSILTLPIRRKDLPIAEFANLSDTGQSGQQTPRKPVVYRIWEVGPVSARTLRTPSYRLHKPTGRAVVTLWTVGTSISAGIGTPGESGRIRSHHRRVALQRPTPPGPDIGRRVGSHRQRVALGLPRVRRFVLRQDTGSRQRSRPASECRSGLSANSTATSRRESSGLSNSKPFARR